MSIITLTTDYGLKDHFVGSLKGKILTEFPEATIIDISHDIDAFNIAETSYIIGAAYSSFPKGTVHLIGVDIERNRETQHIAMQWNDQYFICADNGVLSILTQKIIPQKIVAINIHDRLHSDATDLDVFVKVACHLAKGGLLNVIGKEITSIKDVTELQATVLDNQIKGNVIYIDHYGNVVTNISKNLFLETGKGRPYEITFGRTYELGPIRNKKIYPIKTILSKYSDIILDIYSVKDREGEKLAIFNETGFLEIAVFRSNPKTVGSASSLLGLNYYDTVIIEFKN
ncbi:SAM hydrolase/SAM-dependent halogenase family protein [Flavobacterium solisilvae]|uniref:SAM-dependent chlorinase/fluorinase n=1 Tax=Flavobacterium solisilvae TaxID=1852019 RepID=A0ABX1QSB6_9FLAO|nr:SAM-dependent chlorinase/fluorinase [Flavobacterium solisilvae]NMH23963.1 SAM-dependent chlorinase/fluorinase [Flavobacterium solisilvae]